MSEPVTLESAIRQVSDLRAKILSGSKIPKEELRMALDNLRAGRSSATATKKAKKEKAAPIDLASLFETKAE